PDRPERRPVAHNSPAVGENGLDRRKNLQARVAAEILPPREQRPGIAPQFFHAGLSVLFRYTDIEIKQDAGGLPVQWIGMDMLVIVKWPEIRIAFHAGVVRPAEQRPDTRS